MYRWHRHMTFTIWIQPGPVPLIFKLKSIQCMHGSHKSCTIAPRAAICLGTNKDSLPHVQRNPGPAGDSADKTFNGQFGNFTPATAQELQRSNMQVSYKCQFPLSTLYLASASLVRGTLSDICLSMYECGRASCLASRVSLTCYPSTLSNT